MPFSIIGGTVRKVSSKPTASVQADVWWHNRAQIRDNYAAKKLRKQTRAKARALNYNNRMFNLAHAQARA